MPDTVNNAIIAPTATIVAAIIGAITMIYINSKRKRRRAVKPLGAKKKLYRDRERSMIMSLMSLIKQFWGNRLAFGRNIDQSVDKRKYVDKSIHIGDTGCIYGRFPSIEECEGKCCDRMWSCPAYRNYVKNMPG